MPRIVPALALAALFPCAALAASPQLSVHRVQIDRESWPRARAYLSIVSATGGPMPAIGPDFFKVYEAGRRESAKILKVETLEGAGAGTSVVVVVQASGAMAPVGPDLAQAVSGFIASLGAKDAAACVSFGDGAEIVSPLSFGKDEVARKCGAISFTAKSFLLYDGLVRAIGAFPRDESFPGARAIVLVADGRDNGSTADIETVVGEARKRGIPVHSVGHSEVEQEPLAQLAQISRRTLGTYRAAPDPGDLVPSLAAVHEIIRSEYLLEWKTELPHDGKDHRVEVALQADGNTLLENAQTVRTPPFVDWLRVAALSAAALLAVLAALALYFSFRRRSVSAAACPVCQKPQEPDWEACLFCLEEASAQLLVQKGLDKGKRFPLVGKSVSVGSGPDNAIRLADGAVSGRHAGVSIDDGRFEIVDLGSRNGVLVNGRRTPRRLLEDGDVITVGLTELKFETRTPPRDGPARW
ncbi:MAG: FHA domain-containing protein [Myxococcales bacterium]